MRLKQTKIACAKRVKPAHYTTPQTKKAQRLFLLELDYGAPFLISDTFDHGFFAEGGLKLR